MLASPLANKRTDDYGGELNGRLRLARDIINGIRTFLDEHFILSYRMGWNDDMYADIQTAHALEALGVELLHVSSGIPVNRYVAVPNDFLYNSIVLTGTEIKRHVKIPVTVVNDIRTFHRGNALLENELCDFVAFGKPFLADPSFYTNSLLNYDHQPCLRCKTCRWFTNGKYCPAVNRSGRLDLQESNDKK